MKITTLLAAVLFVVFTLTSHSHAQSPLVTIDMVTVGDAGNAADTTGYGAVADVFAIGKYEVTIGQYTTFLNTVATEGPGGEPLPSYLYNLWSVDMLRDGTVAGINRSGAGTKANPYSYSVIGSSNRPITFVNWLDAARFANWMHNGADGWAATEFGAYALFGRTNNGDYERLPGARWFLPTEDQWYKAAYYKGGSTNAGYWDYPTQSDTAPGNTIGGEANQANYYNGVYSVTQSSSYSLQQNYLTDAGAFSNSASAYGTFDQAGNVFEWNETVISGASRGLRGGAWDFNANYLQSSLRFGSIPTLQEGVFGFRMASLASVPVEPFAITNFTRSGNTAELRWLPLSANTPVRVERTTDLSGPWTAIATNLISGSFNDTNAPTRSAFYRLATEP